MSTNIKELNKVSSSRETKYKVYIDGELFTICQKEGLKHHLTLAAARNKGFGNIKVVKEITTKEILQSDDRRFMEENGIDW